MSSPRPPSSPSRPAPGWSAPSVRPPHRAARSRPRNAALLAVGVAVALTLGACSGSDDEAPPPASPPAPTDIAGPPDTAVARYVALGDSFAALGPTNAPTSGPEACLRSTRNYPSLLAGDIRPGEFIDATCGGARTVDMTAPQIPETPPQFDALTAETDLVTLSIGGNDIGFGDIVGCVMRTARVADGAPCRERLDGVTSDALAGLAGRLDDVYAGIRERSPDARIVTTAYLPLVPELDSCDFVDRMSPGDVDWTRSVTERINRVVVDAADRAGAAAVLPDDAASRHACAPVAGRYTDFTGIETASHPMHPTAAGHRAMAEAVADVL
ncbi:SGNH/GDSL hydrolase family protein [Dietzia cinnamea]|uniref:SGNH/GDSL hydrolase family protein n=1 Tax=Dietzia cinnamea TaxID=321318 RepID=A0ABV3YH38_9ACTN|nr:SGNH/GDSL hydrolase family protein [Dietzia cinnamea]